MTPVCYNFDELDKPNYPQYVIGPFNGIFCLYGRDQGHILLWNPATREFKCVLGPHPNHPPHVYFYHFFGFGLDLITNHNEIVWIRRFFDEEMDNTYNPTSVAVYNLSIDSWRVFEVHLESIRSIDDSLSSTYMNGVYYWLTSENFDNFMILSLDMHDEDFQELPAPPDIPKSQFGDLATYNGSIVLILYCPQEVEKYFDIWEMEEKGFWTKQLTIGPLVDVLCPVGIQDNGSLFVRTNTSNLVLYNSDATANKDLGHYDSNHKVFIYKESLVSFKGGNECQERDDMVQA